MKRTIFTRSFQTFGMAFALMMCCLVSASLWAQPACTGGNSPVTFINEDFETTGIGALPAGWTESPTFGFNGWRVQNNTGSVGTGCDNEKSGAQRLDFETSGMANGAIHDVFFTLDLSNPNINAPIEMSFWYYMFGGNVGTLQISAAPAGTTNFTTIFSLSGQQHSTANCTANDWLQGVADLSSFAGQPIDIRIRGINGTQGTSFQGDILLDLLQVIGCGIPCTITCPADIVVGNDPGTCGANVSIPLPTFTGLCASTSIHFSEDFDGAALPAGWTQSIISGGGGNTGTGPCGSATLFHYDCINVTTIFAPPNANFSGTIAMMDDDGAQPGFVGVAAITSPVIDLSGLTGHMLTVDYSHNTLGGSTFEIEVWNGVAWVNEFIEAGDAAGTATIDLGAYTNSDFQVRFLHDDNGAWAWGTGFDNVQISFASAPMPTNDYNGTADASDFYPVGTTIVTFELIDIFGLPVTCSFNVTVNDTEAPTFTSCPNDIVVNLDPGACDQIVSYVVEAVDNCPSDPTTLAGPFCDPCQDPTGGSALACAPFAQNSIIQFVDVPANSQIEYFCYNQETFGNTPLATINVYLPQPGGAVPFQGGGFTPVMTMQYQTNVADNGQCVCLDFPMPFSVPSTGVWIEVFTPGTTLNSRDCTNTGNMRW